MTSIEKLNRVSESMIDTGTARRIDLFILSLYNPKEFRFSIGALTDHLDEDNIDLMLDAIREYWKDGESNELRRLGPIIRERRGL